MNLREEIKRNKELMGLSDVPPVEVDPQKDLPQIPSEPIVQNGEDDPESSSAQPLPGKRAVIFPCDQSGWSPHDNVAYASNLPPNYTFSPDWNVSNACVPVGTQPGDVGEVTNYAGYTGKIWVSQVYGSCNYMSVGNTTMTTMLPAGTSCDGCCISNWGWTVGNCGQSCDPNAWYSPCGSGNFGTLPSASCASTWFQNPNANWAATWINNRDCSNYNWPATNLENTALALMANAPIPQTGPYNNASDIWGAANAAWTTGGPGSPKNQFIGKMAKAKYSQCQQQACNC